MSIRKIREIVLIEPGPPGIHIYKRTPIWRLGLPQIGALQKAKGRDVVIIAEILTGFLNSSDWRDIEEADAVGISTITCTALRSYRLAQQIRELGKPVILGGSHVTFFPEEASKYGDVCLFDGYFTFDEWINFLEGKISKENVYGLAYRDNKGRFIRNSPRKRNYNMDDYFYPDNSLVKGIEKAKFIPLMFSLSCTSNCSFCSVISMFGRCWRHYSARRVVNEMNKFKNQVSHFFITDDNLFNFHSETMKFINEKINSEVKEISWSAQTKVTLPFYLDENNEPLVKNGRLILDKERLEKLQESNFKIAYQGHESINPETLKDYNKSQTPEIIAQNVEELLKYGTRTHGMYVLGGEHDTSETIKETVNFILESKISTAQLFALVPAPGSRDFKKYKNFIFDWNYDHWNGQYVVFKPKRITPLELQKGIEEGYKKIYSIKNCLTSFINFPFRTKFGTFFLRCYGRKILKEGIIKNQEYKLILEKLENI